MDENGLEEVFETFAKDGKISLSCLKKWFKEAAVIGKDTGISEADVDAAVAESSKRHKILDFSAIKECVNALADLKKIEPKELMEKLAAAGPMKSATDATDVPKKICGQWRTGQVASLPYGFDSVKETTKC
ncbi:hypothetical protein AVEN_136855-1 [Araneus ventricosus]|uniref:EF-hand domain-containing protein n=1 Tax=Araneus ventricosus TaxID=182803 RepID=A0A4Y2G5S6_ARAVE|nr:hypothetical protein AVEN_136855-1 [Araneus ventricosus]